MNLILIQINDAATGIQANVTASVIGFSQARDRYHFSLKDIPNPLWSTDPGTDPIAAIASFPDGILIAQTQGENRALELVLLVDGDVYTLKCSDFQELSSPLTAYQNGRQLQRLA